jgi:O-6-methylguanine DNA methyltransferase
MMSSQRFAESVLRATRRIPPGRVATYGDVAAMAGRPRAARAVGNIMRGCGDQTVPCHRVVGAGGTLGGYGGQSELKRALLRAEGIIVFGRRIRAFASVRWPARASLPGTSARATPSMGSGSGEGRATPGSRRAV